MAQNNWTAKAVCAALLVATICTPANAAQWDWIGKGAGQTTYFDDTSCWKKSGSTSFTDSCHYVSVDRESFAEGWGGTIALRAATELNGPLEINYAERPVVFAAKNANDGIRSTSSLSIFNDADVRLRSGTYEFSRLTVGTAPGKGGTLRMDRCSVNVAGHAFLGAVKGAGAVLMEVDGGTLKVDGYLGIGEQAVDTASRLLISGGSVTNSAFYATIGGSGRGVMTIRKGGKYGCVQKAEGIGMLVSARSAGTVNVEGGEVFVGGRLLLCHGPSAVSAEVNVTDGGVMTVGNIAYGNGATAPATITVNGGTIRALSNHSEFIPAYDRLTFYAGGAGATFDTAGHAITIAEDIDNLPGETGKVTLRGGGAVTYLGTMRHAGRTTIEAGTLLRTDSAEKANGILSKGLSVVVPKGGTADVTPVVAVTGPGAIDQSLVDRITVVVDAQSNAVSYRLRLSDDGKTVQIRALPAFQLKGVSTGADGIPEFSRIGGMNQADTKALPVIPQPRAWHPVGNGTFAIPGELRVFGSSEAAAALVSDWRRLRGNGAAAASSRASANVVFAPAGKECQDVEGYRIEISPAKIVVAGESQLGEYWATRTLIQLFLASDRLQCGVIEDKPKYAYRGFMLDVARKPYSMSFLAQLTKTLAYYKMNVFHIHLNDDGANTFVKEGYRRFRMECETCPELTAKDLYYTKAEFRSLVKGAARIGVTIVPEIDSPAHAGSISAARPEFASKKYGRSHLDLDNPEVVEFMDKLFAEYLTGPDPVFPGPYFHVGTDEYPKGAEEPFRAYTDKMLRLVKKYGRTPCAWGALSHADGKTPVMSDGVIMDIWYNPYYDPLKAIAAGYKIVSVPDSFVYIVPAAGYYHDYLDCKWLYERWEPCNIKNVTIPSDHPQLLGGKFALWNDQSGNGISEDDTFDRVFPAMQTLSQKMWTGTSRNQTWRDFSALAGRTGEAPGVNQADRLTGPGMRPSPDDKAVGWSQNGGYTVSFEVRPPEERGNTVLFDDGFSQVRLFDGKIGFSRDGFSFAYEFSPKPRAWTSLTFVGDPGAVELIVDGKSYGRSSGERPCIRKKRNGKVVERWYESPRTLHFPLRKPKGSETAVRNLRVRTGV